MNTPVSLSLALSWISVALLNGVALAVELPEAAPDFVWAQQAGSAGADKTRGLATDAAGNVYMTGEFSKTGTFGEFTVESKGDLDFFVAKYSPAGGCLLVGAGGGGQSDRGVGGA